MRIIHTDKAPAAIGPYSQAYEHNGILYCSGQIAIDPSTGNVVEGGIKEQTAQILKNIDAVLKAAGTCPEKVLRATCYLADMSLFGEFNAVYGDYFTGKPARSCVAVKGLPKNVLAEVEVTAVIE